MNNVNSSAKGSRRAIRRAVQIALASSMLGSGISMAALQDRGAQDPTLVWPQWYRDNSTNGVDGGGLALGLCKSQVPSPDPAAAGAPMCFPITPNPVGFAGNVGDEIFYTNLNVNVTNGGIDLRYVMGLEAAYGTANPVGAPVHGQEVVFARTRFLMHVNKPECAGDYRIIHPYGDETFPDVPEGKRALFSTLDIPVGAILDFDTVVDKGQVAPFLHWDDGQEHVLSRTNPAANPLGEILSVTPVGGAQQQFIGDPSVPHTFTGSPLVETIPGTGTDTTPALPRYTINNDGITPAHQNYVKVIAPPGCDIGGTPIGQTAPDNTPGEGVNVNKVNTGFLMGQVWTAPIPTPTKVTQAKYSRTDNDVTIDVWATSSATPQTLLATGTGLRGVQLKADPNDPKKYEAHLVLTPGTPVPPGINVVNTTSNPVLNIDANLTDYLTINKAEYDPSTGKLCVSAKSSDVKIASLNLGYTGLAGTVPFDATPKDGCPAVVAGDFTASVDVNLPHAPTTVSVTSGVQGSEAIAEVSVKANTPDNDGTSLIAVNDTITAEVSGGSASDINVLADNGNGPDIGFVAGTTSVVVVDQPYITKEVPDLAHPATPPKIVKVAIGTAAGNPDGTIHFVPNPGTAGPGSLSYVLKKGNQVSQVSSLAQVNLANIVFQATPPTAAPDNFAVFRGTAAAPTSTKLNLVKNDVAGVGTSISNDSISLYSDAAGTTPLTLDNANRTIAVNKDGTGTVQYTTKGVAVADDVFYYRVKSTGGGTTSVDSAPVKVDVVVENTAESLNITRNRFVNQAGNPRYDVRFTTSWFGAPLTPSGTCYVTSTTDTAKVTTNWGFTRPIGSGPADATGAVQLANPTTKMINAAGYDPAVDVPNIPSKWTYRVQCQSSNSGTTLSTASVLTQP